MYLHSHGISMPKAFCSFQMYPVKHKETDPINQLSYTMQGSWGFLIQFELMK